MIKVAVEFRLLGDVEVSVDGRRIDLGHARQRCVLAVLLVEVNLPVRVDQLVDRVWGARAPSRARETIYSYRSRLHSALAPAGDVGPVRTSGGYVLTTDPMTVDVHRFRRWVTEARDAKDDAAALALLERALCLWRGEVFATLDTPWFNAERAALERERVAVELDRNDCQLRLRQHAQLLAGLSIQAEADPEDERLIGQLMLALYRCGRRADALGRYWQLKSLLDEKLGIDPGPDLTRLYERMLANAPELFLPEVIGPAPESTSQVAEQRAAEPLREPYRSADATKSPLQLLRAEYGVVPFRNRDELTILRDWSAQVTAGYRTGLAVVTGLGGSGKTRLVLELADQQRRAGWYAGVLPKDGTGINRLTDVTVPLLVVIDYADGRVPEVIALLKVLRVRRGPPAVVVLTARSTEGDWLPAIENALVGDRHRYRTEPIALPDTHPDSLDVYHRTVTALTPAPVTPLKPPQGIRWTTLDYVLLGWIAAQDPPTLPASRAGLYQQALLHEVSYWCTTHGGDHPEGALLRKAAACVSLVSPDEQQAYRVLAAIDELVDDPWERRAVRRTLVTCLSPAPGDGLAVRPDPIGDHLLLEEVSKDPQLLSRTLTLAGEAAVEQAVVTLARAGQNDISRATALIIDVLVADISRWRAVLSVALAQGGAAAASLGELVGRAETPLPLDEVAQAIPFASTGLYDLGFAVEQRRLDTARAAHAEPRDLAKQLVRVSGRASHAGDRAIALASIAEAVQHYRQLAAANPPMFLPNFAASLNSLSSRQSEIGDRAGALASITESVNIRRRLADSDPSTYLPDLALSLNNMSVHQSDTGDRVGALVSITESVDVRRRLADEDPSMYLPGLAEALTNLGNHQSDTGDRAGAFVSSTEAVKHYRQLAGVNPTVYLPGLAASVNNLSNRRSEIGDRAGALESSIEAVKHYRQLADVNPAVYLPYLVATVDNLSNRQSDTGDPASALVSSTEAVEHYRWLADANRTMYLPGLAKALARLSMHQSATGDRSGALASSTEAVEQCRQLVETDTAVHLANLAACLGKLSNHQSDIGDRAGALASITEAVEYYRQLIAVNPTVHLSSFAACLTNLSNRRSAVGDRAGALLASAEAVGIRRELVDANPAVHLPVLASSLNNLSNHRSGVGDRVGALTSITEAVNHYRLLVDTDPTVYRPELAASVDNLSNHRSAVGDRAGALLASAEAVGIRRQLVDANPAMYLPSLAGSLNNLSNRQSETGDRAAALTSVTEAVDILRQVADVNFEMFLPYLASSLTNLSNQQNRTGDWVGALASGTDAVEHYRRLAHTYPAVFLPDLATALNNLSVHQGNTGDHAAALIAITEAVDIRRGLAQINPEVFLSELAASLCNLCLHQSATGNYTGALVSGNEAVKHYRQLAHDDFTAHLPGLAEALTNLSNRRSETGDKAGALASITEAIEHYRQLAHTHPAVFLPDLIRSLNSMFKTLKDPSEQPLDDRAAKQISAAWQHSIDAMPYPAARAGLRAAWVGQLSASEEQACEQLRRAAAEADEAAPAGREHDRGWVVVAMRARKAVRAHAVSHDGDLPVWASVPLPDDHTELVDAFSRATDWPATQVVLDQARHLLSEPEFRRTLTVLQRLDLDDPAATRLAQLLAEIDRSNIDTVFAARRADHHRRILLDEWITIPTWPESFAFLHRHATVLITDEVRRLLRDDDAASAGRHLAILDLLAAGTPTERVEAVVKDPDTAENAVFDAIERGDLTTLATTLHAAPQLQERTITHAVAIIVLRLAADDLDSARAMTLDVVEHATAVQRRAHTIRLRTLRAQRPDLTGLDEILTVIRPDGAVMS